MGQHLLELAQKHPEQRVLGVDLYLPGIASVVLAAQRASIAIVRRSEDAIGADLHSFPRPLAQAPPS